jgi:hypothetical protein
MNKPFTFRRLLKGRLGILLLAGIICLPVLPAQAQFFGGLYGSQTIAAAAFPTNYLTSTNFVIAPTTNATVSGIQIYNARNIGFQLQASGMTNAASGTIGVAFARSLDGANWDTANLSWFTMTVPAATSGQQLVCTNMAVDGVGWVALASLTNSFTLTNVAVRYAIRPGY